jgi:hypothetical protein
VVEHMVSMCEILGSILSTNLIPQNIDKIIWKNI